MQAVRIHAPTRLSERACRRFHWERKNQPVSRVRLPKDLGLLGLRIYRTSRSCAPIGTNQERRGGFELRGRNCPVTFTAAWILFNTLAST